MKKGPLQNVYLYLVVVHYNISQIIFTCCTIPYYMCIYIFLIAYPLAKFVYVLWEYIKNTLGIYPLCHYTHPLLPSLYKDISWVYIQFIMGTYQKFSTCPPPNSTTSIGYIMAIYSSYIMGVYSIYILAIY